MQLHKKADQNPKRISGAGLRWDIKSPDIFLLLVVAFLHSEIVMEKGDWGSTQNNHIKQSISCKDKYIK